MSIVSSGNVADGKGFHTAVQVCQANEIIILVIYVLMMDFFIPGRENNGLLFLHTAMAVICFDIFLARAGYSPVHVIEVFGVFP